MGNSGLNASVPWLKDTEGALCFICTEDADLVTWLHTQARLLGNSGLNASFPWLKDTEGALCFICKEDIDNTDHF